MKETFFCFIFGLLLISTYGQSKKSLPWTYRKPLFVEGNGGNGEGITWHSVLSGHVEGLPCGSWVSCSDFRGYTVLAMNFPIKDLYQLAYATIDDSILMCMEIPESRTILDAKDSSKYVSVINNVEHPENTYTYQLLVPKTNFTELKVKMQEDLKRYFGLEVSIKKRKMKCWVLSADDPSQIYSHGGKFDKVTRRHEGLMIKNLPIAWLIRTLEENIQGYPIINSINYRGNIDFEIMADLSDPISIDQAIQKYKMHLKLQTRKVDILILKETKKALNN